MKSDWFYLCEIGGTRMKYAVIYQSKSGNTREVAEEIYKSLSTDEKVIQDIDREEEIPQADIYLVGFGIRNQMCSMDVINCFDQITSGRFAVFATCGYVATEQYKANLEKRLDVWMPEDADYLGMFLCQGRVSKEGQKNMLDQMPEEKERMKQLFEYGESHPDREDLEKAAQFAREIQQQVES